MKLTIQSQVLNKALRQIAPSIPKNSIIPILDHCHVTVSKDKCTLMATNSNMTSKVEVDCTADEEFVTLLPFKDLLDISGLSSSPLNIEVTDNVVVTSGKQKYKLGKTGDVSVFPIQPEQKTDFEIEVDAEFFRHLQLAKRCVIKDSNDFDFKSGICVEVSNQSIYILSTDGTQLFRYKAPTSVKGNIQVIMGIDIVNAASVLNSATIYLSEKYIKFESLNATIIGKLTELKFPDISFLFSNYKDNCGVDRVELLSSVNAMNVFGSLTKSCLIEFGKDKLHLHFEDIDTDKNADAEIASTHSVEIEKIRVNAAFLKNLLTMLPESETIFFCFTAHDKPIHIDSDDKKLTLILTPQYL